MAEKKPIIKVKIPTVIPKKISVKFAKSPKKLSSPKDSLTIDEQNVLVNSWFTDKTLKDLIVSKINKEQSISDLKKEIAIILGCSEFNESLPLNKHQCNLLSFSSNNFLLIRNYSSKSLVVSILDIIFSSKDYDKNLEVKKIREKCLEKGISEIVIDKLIKDIYIDDFEPIIFQNLLDTYNELYSYNLVIFLENYNGLNVIISSIKEGQSLIGIIIDINRISKLSFLNLITMEVNESIDNLDFQEQINIKSIKSEPKSKIETKTETKTDIKKAKIPIIIATKSKEPKEIGEYISINPDDLLVKLPVVKITIDGIEYQFLMGKTGNLYTKTSDNILIGRIKGSDLMLVEGYRDYL